MSAILTFDLTQQQIQFLLIALTLMIICAHDQLTEVRVYYD